MHPKSKDFDIRAALVDQLLAEGFSRNQIRHELTLDTSSSGGRADVVLLRPDAICGIEIKSGSDRLDRLEAQAEAYERSFDYTTFILDKRHYSDRLSYRYTEILYCHDIKGFVRKSRGEFQPVNQEEFIDYRFAFFEKWRKSRETNPVGMARLLWREGSEAITKQLGRGIKTRSDAIRWIQENVSMAQLRPLVIEYLMQRDYTSYEHSFWRKYDDRAVT